MWSDETSSRGAPRDGNDDGSLANGCLAPREGGHGQGLGHHRSSRRVRGRWLVFVTHAELRTRLGTFAGTEGYSPRSQTRTSRELSARYGTLRNLRVRSISGRLRSATVRSRRSSRCCAVLILAGRIMVLALHGVGAVQLPRSAWGVNRRFLPKRVASSVCVRRLHHW
jgi:hypothetical protein